jgi:hypothetical protein
MPYRQLRGRFYVGKDRVVDYHDNDEAIISMSYPGARDVGGRTLLSSSRGRRFSSVCSRQMGSRILSLRMSEQR